MKKSQSLTKGAWITAICLAAAGSVWGQAVTGSIFGNVADPTTGAVAHATVRAINTGTSETHVTNTDNQGAYVFPSLPIGQYRVEAEAAGFKKSVREGVTLALNQNARVDLSLEVGTITQEVRVVGDVPLVDTREVQLGGTVDQERVVDLPLNGRNVYSLTTILPGVISATTPLVGSNEGNYVIVNGNRQRQTNFLLDGGINNNLFRNGGNQAPNPDTVEEFHLLTSNFDAEFGRLAGGVINVVTKSGTNQFHGALFEFLRNNDLNARNFFQPTVATLRQNQFGASGGGPILKNRTFFFASYQGLRVRNGVFINSGITPTVAERNGDFSALPAGQQPVDPLTGNLFPGGMIPKARLDPVAQNILQLVALPNTPDGRVQVSSSASTNDDEGFIKVDHQINSGNKITASVFLIHGLSFDPFNSGTQIPNYGLVNTTFDQHNIIVNEIWTLRPTLLNEARFSYTGNEWATISPIRTSWSDFGSHLTLGALPPRPPQIFVNGYWQMGTYGEEDDFQRTMGGSDTMSWMHGSHSIKFGGSVYHNTYTDPGNWLGAGQIRFTGAFTKNSLADFELGEAASFRQNSGQNRNFYSNSFAGFVQDDWKISPKVTLNLGLRYEVDGQMKSPYNALQTFQFGRQSQVFPTAPLGLLYPGDPGIPDSVLPTRYNDFAPRVGLAWDVFGNGRTAVRAGYGIFYASTIENITSNLQGQPFLVDVTVFGTPNLVDPYANVPGGSPFPYTLNQKNPLFSLPITASYVGEGLGVPYVQQYNFTVQQQLFKQWSLQVGYVGNQARKMYMQRDANAPVYIPGASTAGNVNNRRPYLPGVFGEIAETETAANSNYNSLQVSAVRKFANGLSLMLNYTRSKTMDIASDDELNPTVVAFVNSNNVRMDHAPADFDTRNLLALSYLWDLPSTNRWGVIGKEVLSGWQVNGITTLHSGNPFNVTYGVDNNLDGNNTDRPDVIGNPNLDTGRGRSDLIARYFNTAAFRAPAGLYGTAGRNLIYGPGYVNTDFSAFKIFAITERHKIQFRAEIFNLFNQVNFSNPNATLTSPSFGRILAAGSPRIVQFGLKYMF